MAHYNFMLIVAISKKESEKKIIKDKD